MSNRHLIFVPGLSNGKLVNRVLNFVILNLWMVLGFKTQIIALNWEDNLGIVPKLQVIISKIDELSGKNQKIYLLGISAGGAAVLNAFSERCHVIAGVASLVGRLKRGVNVEPTLDSAISHSPAYVESVLLFENCSEPSLSKEDRSKILTMRPIYDRWVPIFTVSLQGANNLQLPVKGHAVSCILFPTIFAGKIVKFFNML